MSVRGIQAGSGLKVALRAILLLATVIVPFCAAIRWFHAQPENGVARSVLPALLILYVLLGSWGSAWMMQRGKADGETTVSCKAPASECIGRMRLWRRMAALGVVGAGAWLFGWLLLSIWWNGYVVGFLALVAPVSTIVIALTGIGGLAGGSSWLSGFWMPLAVGCALNVITWGYAGLAMEWSRHRARPLFSVFVGVLAAFWGLGLVFVVVLNLR